MKSLHCIAAAPLIFMSACATVETSTGGASPLNTGTNTLYCWQDRLQNTGARVECNWADSIAKACNETRSSNLDKAAIATEPARTHRCNNGQWLVQVTKK